MTTVLPDGAPSKTLFPDQAAAVADLRSGALLMAAINVLPGVTLSDSYIYNKILVAEKELSRLLRVDFVPTVIVPWEASQEELDALEEAGAPWKQEAAYDYGPEMWQGDRWGMMKTRSKPIISVQSMKFVYPAPGTSVFEVPADWLRMDRKSGQINLLPTSTAYLAPLNSFIMSSMTGGRHVPLMVQLRYTAGLKDVPGDWPDIIDLIKRKAMLKIVQDAFIPQSSSISADGLSQSMGIDITKYGEAIEEAINGPKGSNGGLMTAIHGIRIGVM